MSYREVVFEKNIVVKHIKEIYDLEGSLQEVSYYAIFEVEEDGWENEIARADSLYDLLKNC